MSVAARCREVGSALVIDVSQSLGALPFELAAIRPDFLACAGYKWLLGPYSLSYLYVAPRWQDGQPIEHNWIARIGSEDFAGLVDYQDGYQSGARRFDVGERAHLGRAQIDALVALVEALGARCPVSTVHAHVIPGDWDKATGVAIQEDGKIVVVGYMQMGSFDYDMAVVRLNTDGSLDTTFDGDGKVRVAFNLGGKQVRYLAIQPQRSAVIDRIELVKGPDATAPIVVAITVETPE